MKLAIFDFDGTLVNEETLPFMVRAWGSLGYSKKKQYNVIYRILLDFIVYKSPFHRSFDKKKFRDKAMHIFLDIFKDMPRSEINLFFKECFNCMEDSFNNQVIQEVEMAKSLGYETVLLSGCYSEFLRLVGNFYDFDHIIGSDINYLNNGLINYQNPVKVNMGDRKVAHINSHFGNKDIDWDSSIAYGDSYYDYDILSLVGKPVAVNPDDRLKEIAIDNSWRIIKNNEKK